MRVTVGVPLSVSLGKYDPAKPVPVPSAPLNPVAKATITTIEINKERVNER